MTKILLILLLLFLAVTNWVWLAIDTQPPWWDQADYLCTSVQYAHRLQKLDLGGLFKDFIFFNRVRQPLVMLVTAPVYLFSFGNDDLAVMVNILFMAITFLAIFKLCKHFLSPQAALLSCFILSVYPGVFQFTRSYLMETGLMSMVTLNVYSLLKCDGFKSRKYSILLGLSLAMGMLTKVTFAVFLAGPFLYIAWKSLPDKKGRLNLIYCLIIASALTLCWYIPNLEAIKRLIYEGSIGEAASRPKGSIWDLSALTWYPVVMTNYGISGFLTLLFLGSSVFFILSHAISDRVKKVFIWWILLPLFVFTLSLKKDTRFLVPLLPAVAIITGHGLCKINFKITKTIIIGLTVLVGLFQYLVYSFDIPLLSNALPYKRIAWGNILLFNTEPWRGLYPGHEEWMVEDVIDVIKTDMGKEKIKEGTAILLANHKAYNALTLNYYSIKERLGLCVQSAAWTSDVSSYMAEKNYLYVIYKEPHDDTYIKRDTEKIDEAFVYVEEHPEEFMAIYKKKLFDGSCIVVYKAI